MKQRASHRTNDDGDKRQCSRCLEWKLRTAEWFKPVKQCKGGIGGTCRACIRIDSRSWKKDNYDRLLKKSYGQALVKSSIQWMRRVTKQLSQAEAA